MNKTNDQIRKDIIKLTKNIRRTVIQKIQEQQNEERKEKMLESINNIINRKVDDYILALYEGFPSERFENKHLLSLLSQLQDISQDINFAPFIKNQIYSAMNEVSTELNSQNNGTFTAAIIGVSLVFVAGAYLLMNRRRK